MSTPISIDQYHTAAANALPQMVYDYYAGGARDEITLSDNQKAYQRLQLRPRVLRDIRERDLSTTVVGHTLDVPFLIAPTAFHRMACDAGERATVQAAGALGTAMTLSTLSTTAVEDVTDAAAGPVWFQLYVYTDRGATRDLVRRAEAAGCSALVLTVDAQIWGVRERDEHNNFTLPEGLAMQNLEASGKAHFPETEGSGLAAYVNERFDKALTWDDVDWLAGLTDLPVLVKGVLRGDDAARAADHGAAAVVVSNHGGRQLDTVPATIDALPDVVAALEGTDTEVLLDGGIRRGTDVLKALALGASAVGVGRPVLWGLAVNGAAGAEHALSLLRQELDTAMALCGVRSVDEATPDLVRSA